MPSKRAIDNLLDSLEPRAARAFRRAVAGIKSRAQLARLVAAIEAQDVDAAIRAAGLSAGSWNDVTNEIRNAFTEGGVLVAADAPRRLGFVFNVNNPRAQSWLADHSSNLVTRIMQEQREAIRATLETGFSAGRNPRSVALDIIGRMDSATGRRQGGIVGLTEQMAGYVRNAQGELENLDGNYFSRKRRDQRFDKKVARAIATDTPLTAAEVNRITARYSDRLLNLRGENIGRTEMLGSVNEAMDEALRQAVDEDLIQPENIRRVWDATGDSRTRADHINAEGQAVGLNEPFIVGGVRMMHPGDFGAPASQVINCRCVVRQEVDWLAA